MSAQRRQGRRGSFTPRRNGSTKRVSRAIRDGLAAGLGFDKACDGIEATDAELRRIIVDDYLKVTIAQRNFQGTESTSDIAESLGISVERVEAARREMIAEVAAASVDVFHRQGGEVPDA